MLALLYPLVSSVPRLTSPRPLSHVIPSLGHQPGYGLLEHLVRLCTDDGISVTRNMHGSSTVPRSDRARYCPRR